MFYWHLLDSFCLIFLNNELYFYQTKEFNNLNLCQLISLREENLLLIYFCSLYKIGLMSCTVQYFIGTNY